MNRAGRLGALAERNFRLVFTSTTVSALGDGVASIALVFAVLQISDNSPTAVGIVIASRQVAAAAITLAAGVWADRLPRHLVLFAVAGIQAVVQTLAGVSIVTGHATVPLRPRSSAHRGSAPCGGIVALRFRPRRPLVAS